MTKDRQQAFTDLRRLISPFESPFSIVNKFAELNHIPIWHAKQYFPRPTSKPGGDSGPGSGPMARLNFNNGCTYSENIITMLTYIPKEMYKFHNIGSMLTISEITALTSVSFLRYCPICMEFGYHSVFYQMFLFALCPIHNVNLIDKCYKCNLPITYDLNDKQKSAYSCCNCEYKFWNRFYQKSGTQQERLMKLPIDVRDEFERVFFWLANLKECAILRPVFEVKHAALIQGKSSLFNVAGMYCAWSDLAISSPSPAVVHGQQNLVAVHHVKVCFGSLATEKRLQICNILECFRVCVGDKVCSGREWQKWNRGQCEVDGSKSLGPIFTSIRRHYFKKLRRNAGISCKLSSFAGNSYRIPQSCRRCEWARAYVLWREYWRLKLKNPLEYWRDLFAGFDEVEDAVVAEWAALWVFALQVLSGLQQAIYMSNNQFIAGKELCPCLSCTWALVPGTSGKHPFFHHWTKQFDDITHYECRTVQGRGSEK